MKKATTVTLANFKGGVGKSVNTSMISYHLAKMGFRTLVIDLDPQAHSTKILFKTKLAETKIMPTITTSFMTAIVENIDVRECIHEISENLYVLPNAVDFSIYTDFLNKEFKKDKDDKNKVSHLKNLLSPLKSEYDFILVDVPPTISKYTDNALMMSDYVVIVLQTEELSFDGAMDFIKYLQDLIDLYSVDIDILGILPVLQKNDSKVDQSILNYAIEQFDESNMFNTVVKRMERIKRFTMEGIKNVDMHDKNVHAVYKEVTAEFLKRLGDEKVAELSHGKETVTK